MAMPSRETTATGVAHARPRRTEPAQSRPPPRTPHRPPLAALLGDVGGDLCSGEAPNTRTGLMAVGRLTDQVCDAHLPAVQIPADHRVDLQRRSVVPDIQRDSKNLKKGRFSTRHLEWLRRRVRPPGHGAHLILSSGIAPRLAPMFLKCVSSAAWSRYSSSTKYSPCVVRAHGDMQANPWAKPARWHGSAGCTLCRPSGRVGLWHLVHAGPFFLLHSPQF